MLESTAVMSKGRISKKDLCIETNLQTKEFKKLVKHFKKINDLPIGIQLSHSGRKGSSEIPWIKSNSPIKNKNEGWATISSSNIPKDTGWPKPKKMTLKDINHVKKKFKNFY